MLLRHGFFLAPLLATALAQREDGANKITYPNVVNQTFNYMDTVDVTFETDYDTPWLYIFCNQSTTGTLLGKRGNDDDDHHHIMAASRVCSCMLTVYK